MFIIHIIISSYHIFYFCITESVLLPNLSPKYLRQDFQKEIPGARTPWWLSFNAPKVRNTYMNRFVQKKPWVQRYASIFLTPSPLPNFLNRREEF